MTHMSLANLAAEIKRQKDQKKDFLATAWDGFIMEPDGTHLELEGLSSFPIGEYAHSDLAEFTRIPKIYYDRMRAEMPTLLAENVNHWLEARKEPRLIRTLAGKVRCVRSNSYRPLDHDQLIEAVMPALAEHPGIKVHACDLTERKMYLRAVLPKLEFEVRKGDIVQFGLSISNSEIGQGALEVAVFALRLICLNGAVMQDNKQRKNHVGGALGEEVASEYMADETRRAIDEAFFLKLRDTTKHMLTETVVLGSVHKMRDAAETKLGARPDKVVKELSKRLDITEGEGDRMLDFLMSGGDLTQWGMANAVTALAKESEDSDRSDELERIGGKIIALGRAEWSRIAEAA
jgi:hypothetical protein